jgi:predicted nucleotidyltransferase component of viral defense system
MNRREAVERFHLMFLRHFAAVISPGTICLKGGVNLRLYHNSPRLSEDIDFDARVVGVDILKKNVNKILAGRPLLTELASVGITLSEIKPAKQTETAQRWKFHVIYEGNPLPTRLEFSRRKDEPFENNLTEPPSAALLAAQQVIPFVFNHYTPAAAYRQKINALATRTHVQARDVFDLHHLSHYAEAGREAPPKLVEQGINQLSLISFDMFHDQVIPFLPNDLARYYGTPEAWKAMSEKVGHDLMSALPPASS